MLAPFARGRAVVLADINLKQRAATRNVTTT
jgi:hypothetical protein